MRQKMTSWCDKPAQINDDKATGCVCVEEASGDADVTNWFRVDVKVVDVAALELRTPPDPFVRSVEVSLRCKYALHCGVEV